MRPFALRARYRDAVRLPSLQRHASVLWTAAFVLPCVSALGLASLLYGRAAHGHATTPLVVPSEYSSTLSVHEAAWPSVDPWLLWTGLGWSSVLLVALAWHHDRRPRRRTVLAVLFVLTLAPLAVLTLT